ncbi:MAG: hypothetical protein FJ087_21785, partial [Deltaproteobacteria bacterium]|nr:hypothetical protein [Deltaproteobacteria bacterium]
GENSCQCQADKDCIPMDDGDLCNGVMKCVANVCSVDPKTVVPCDTSADSQCRVTACVPATGACGATIAADGKPCDDADACTSGEACAAGECAGGSTVACDDQNPCTTDTCDEAAGCVFAPNTDGCDDGDDCTEGDACANGVCQPGKLTCPTTCVPAMSLFCDVSHKHDNGGEGSTNVAAAYACNDGAAYSGPEYTYTFVAPWDGTFTVTLMGEAADTDVLVLEAGDGCDPAKCIAWGTDGVTFTAQSYKTYYLVVDGFEGATGAYSIHVACVPATELYCDDGIDNDKDGDADCDDSDCLGTATCPLPGCVPGWTLACGEKDAWTTYWFGATDQVDGYSCNANLYTGPEYAYSFSTPTKQKVLVKLTNESGTTDLLVLKGDCSSSTCIDHGAVQSTFVAEPNEDYYFVVDGRDGAEGKYTITVTCKPLTEGSCGDGKDDEGDGLTDCDDPDCLGTAECPTCEWAYVLACGDTDSWGTGREGATDVVDAYSCSEAMSHEGPEYTYYFYSEYDQDVTITLSDETADLDIQVLEMDDTQVCNAAKCLDWGVDSLTFAAKAGARYYIVIDAWTGGPDPVFSGDYTIDVSCW